MKKTLYIIWQESFEQDESIIDEQHHALLATINSLHYFLQQGHALEILMPTVKLLLSYLRFHNSTEEGILRAADYPHLDEYIKKNEKVIIEFKAICREALFNKEPDLVLRFLKKWWIAHLEMHDNIKLYISDASGQYCRVD
ncbi:hypothetical protein LCGC14_0484350 [marine sediment metagenome]|uniref:Hemerythrin-like domain-containing protein n=1 Tax=marine sediment metagenome TaxID=412755 RepID=A0A0F9S8E5_9ZZZZ|nr:chemotaxis protein [Methylophaga sp.]HEC58154.1 chemotaxis protein [Methylophaga sp.]